MIYINKIAVFLSFIIILFCKHSDARLKFGPELIKYLFGLRQFVKIPAGSFEMGSDSLHEAFGEKPVHRVTISKPFYIGKHEVTQQQWEVVMGNTLDQQRDKAMLWIIPRARKQWPMVSIGKGKNYPMYFVSWNDTQEFIKRLNQIYRKEIFRLPTEAEWEYACRSETKGEYAGNLDSMAWYRKNSKKTTHSVGQKKPNAWGLYDMYGNLWEWCSDWYDAKYYFKSPKVDPVGPQSGFARVCRGGAWLYYSWHCRSASRFKFLPEDSDPFIGFRLVRIKK